MSATVHLPGVVADEQRSTRRLMLASTVPLRDALVPLPPIMMCKEVWHGARYQDYLR